VKEVPKEGMVVVTKGMVKEKEENYLKTRKAS